MRHLTNITLTTACCLFVFSGCQSSATTGSDPSSAGETSDKNAPAIRSSTGAPTPDRESGVAKEFDVQMHEDLFAKGVYLLEGNTLRLTFGFPGSPRLVDLDSDNEMAMKMTLTRKDGSEESIVGKWTVDSAMRGDKVNEEMKGSVIEFTSDKMVHTRKDGKSRENAYRVGGVPAAPADDQADAIAAFKGFGAEVEIDSNGHAVSVAVLFAPIRDDQLSRIAELTSVTSVELVKVAELTAAGISPLKSLTSIENLALSSDDFTDEWLVPVASLKNLKSLDLAGNRQLTDVKNLNGLSNLVELRLADTGVSDEGIAGLSSLSKLEVLELKRTKVSDAGVAHLKGLTELRQLSLSGGGVINGEIQSGITDTSLEHIKNLTKLEALELNATRITDAGLENLKGLKNLQTLMILSADNITAEGLAKLKEWLPQCRVHGPQHGN